MSDELLGSHMRTRWRGRSRKWLERNECDEVVVTGGTPRNLYGSCVVEVPGT